MPTENLLPDGTDPTLTEASRVTVPLDLNVKSEPSPRLAGALSAFLIELSLSENWLYLYASF